MARASASATELPPVVHHEMMNELGERFAAEVPALGDATIAALEARAPEVIARLDGDFLRAAILLTNTRMADHLRGRPPGPAERPHIALARATAQAGLALEEVDAAYRLGAALAWDVVVRLAEDLRMTPAAALELARLHVEYVDQLARDSLAGFAAVGAALARDRQLLVEALLDGVADLDALAATARWPVPDRVRTGVVVGEAELPDTLLAGRSGGATVVIVAADAALDVPLPLALGSPVAARDANASLIQARRLAALLAGGRVPADVPLRWEEHLPALVVHGDATAADALAAAALAPFAPLPAARRRMLLATLAAWLDHPGQPGAMAAALHLHPQTVRYRIARLRELLGDALDDPAARFELALALRIRPPGADGPAV